MARKIPYRTPEEERAHYIMLTAVLIDRDIEHTTKLVANWPTVKIKRRYNEAMWPGYGSKSPPEVKWWAARKREVTND